MDAQPAPHLPRSEPVPERAESEALADLRPPATSPSTLSPLARELWGVPMFMDLPAAQLNELANQAQHRTFSAGSQIVTPTGAVLVVLTGSAHIFLFDAADKEFRLGEPGPGSVLGEMSCLTPRRSEDEKIRIVAASDVEAIELRAEAFFKTATTHPPTAHRLLTLLAERLAAMNSFTKRAVDIHIDPTSINPTTFRERLADGLTAQLGSFRFLGALGVVSAGWIGVNAGLFALTGWDPYPFVLLNLGYSMLSAAASPIILISQNRQAEIDRLAARTNHRINVRTSRDTARLADEVAALRGELQEVAEQMRSTQSAPPRPE